LKSALKRIAGGLKAIPSSSPSEGPEVIPS
jgi:hypothetical protein